MNSLASKFEGEEIAATCFPSQNWIAGRLQQSRGALDPQSKVMLYSADVILKWNA